MYIQVQPTHWYVWAVYLYSQHLLSSQQVLAKVVGEHQGILHPLYTHQKNTRGVRSGELDGRSSDRAASVSPFPWKISSPRNSNTPALRCGNVKALRIHLMTCSKNPLLSGWDRNEQFLQHRARSAEKERR